MLHYVMTTKLMLVNYLLFSCQKDELYTKTAHISR